MVSTEKSIMVDANFSARITVLRFVLAVLVVFIHNNSSVFNFADGAVTLEVPLWVQIVRDFFSKYLGGIAVPTFFIISGYLFFAKPYSLGTTIKKKFKGIVVPYFMWIILSILLFYLAQSIDFSKQYISNPKYIIRNWSIKEYIDAFLGTIGNPYQGPFVTQFWYVRNLILMMVVSPLIKILATQRPMIYLSFITILILAKYTGVLVDGYGLIYALFYYSLGFYAIHYIKKIIKIIDTTQWKDFLFAYILSLIFTIYGDYNNIEGHLILRFICVIFTICMAFKLAGMVQPNTSLFKKLSYLSIFSFWIYAAHLPFVLNIIIKLFIKFLPLNGAWILVHYFGGVIVCVGIVLFFGITLKKYLPKVFELFNGLR